MKFLDANCCMGNLSVPMPKSISSANELVETMEQAGIDEALVYHTFSKEYSPTVGNQMLLKELEGHENLYPCWVLLPHHTGEMPSPDKLVEEMMEKRDAMCPTGKQGEPWDVAYLALFLASDEAKYITGAALVLDGSLTNIVKPF